MYDIVYDTKKNGVLVSKTKEFKTLSEAIQFARKVQLDTKVFGKPLLINK